MNENNSLTRMLDNVRLYVRRFFVKHMSPHMYFHDLDHTLSVTRTAREIALAEGVELRDQQLLMIAALFHDTGYARTYKGHEARSIEIAERYLLRRGMPKRDIDRVVGMIRCTEMGARPKSRLQRILKDADSAKAGSSDFMERAERLRAELDIVRNEQHSDKSWINANIKYLEGHRFQTPYARKRYDPQKALNLAQLKEMQVSADKRIKQPQLTVEPFFDRDLSWLSFNERVLQEAADTTVPLLERLKFLAIFSSNLDEFYRVRVATQRRLRALKSNIRTALGVTSDDLVLKINRITLKHQRRFGELYREQLVPALKREGISFLKDADLRADQKERVVQWAEKHLLPHLAPLRVKKGEVPFLEDRALYLSCHVKRSKARGVRLFLIRLPVEVTGRFMQLDDRSSDTQLMFIDDVIRGCFDRIFERPVIAAHLIKLSRDAELFLEEEFADSVVEKVRRSLNKRSTGSPSRFLYDDGMPANMLQELMDHYALQSADLVPGARYHNFHDLINVPIKGYTHLRDPLQTPIMISALDRPKEMFEVLKRGDVLMHFPYHDLMQMVHMLDHTAEDPDVAAISITLYRVAKASKVCKALLRALECGKKVTVFVEVQARFDERSNLYWGETLKNAGANVMYSHEGLKVHCKLLLIERHEAGGKQAYAFLSTGNFNERTATLYQDLALWTCDRKITREVRAVFKQLRHPHKTLRTSSLMVAPQGLRSGLERLFDEAIKAALNGKEVRISLKLNSLEDKAMIRKCYDADRAGVRMRMIIRGICCLVPGIKGSSEHIEVISIIDRNLEHARIYWFEIDGRTHLYLSSADLMERNLDRRVEVAFPILDPNVQKAVKEVFEIQWSDERKARIIDTEQRNNYRKGRDRADAVRSQTEIYSRLKASSMKERKSRSGGRKGGRA